MLVFKASLLWYWGFICQVRCTGIQGISALVPRGSIGQRRFICQVWCTGIQGISALVPGGSISQRRFVCQIWCNGIQGIYSQFMGGPSAKEGSSAKYEHTSKFTLASQRSFHIIRHLCSVTWGVYWPKKVRLPNMNTILNLLLLHRGLFILQDISALLPRGPSVKEGSSANYEHTSKFTLASQRSFLQKTNEVSHDLFGQMPLALALASSDADGVVNGIIALLRSR